MPGKAGSRTAPAFTVLVADDEPAARRGVRQLLAPFPEFVVVGECRDGREVLAALDVLKPDVIFLDVQMPEVDGFEVIRRRTPGRMPAIVFLTAYDQFAIQAFDAEAHDYLVKPVSEARFAATIKRLAKRLGSGDRAAGRDQAIVVSTARGATVLRLREIDWIEAADNYARVWAGGRNGATCCANRSASWSDGSARRVSRAPTARRSCESEASGPCASRRTRSSPSSRVARTSPSRAGGAPRSRPRCARNRRSGSFRSNIARAYQSRTSPISAVSRSARSKVERVVSIACKPRASPTSDPTCELRLAAGAQSDASTTGRACACPTTGRRLSRDGPPSCAA